MSWFGFMFVKPRHELHMFYLNVETDMESLQRLPCGDRSCYNKIHISLHVNIGGTLRGFA